MFNFSFGIRESRRLLALLLKDHVVNTNDKIIITTGADSSHYKSLCQFLSSLFACEPNIKAIVFDLGLARSEREYLQDAFPTIELRLFDYSKYPSYFNIRINAGEYAWKPIIVHDILHEFKCCVCWMDAGNKIYNLSWIRRIVKKIGMYSPYSSGCIRDWTHPGTLKFLNVSNDLFKRRNLSGACVAVNYNNIEARKIIIDWRECALIKECIAPNGSSRENHRQDQAVLSVLLHKSGLFRNMPAGIYGFDIHQDID